MSKIWDIEEHQGWGNWIGWIDVKRLQLAGITKPYPEPGDILHCPMKSGKIGKFRFKAVDWKCDPGDQWFADMEKIEE